MCAIKLTTTAILTITFQCRVVSVNLLTSLQPSLLTIVFETTRMKIIVGLLLVATALAYPVAENEEKSNLPLVITDYSSVAEGQQSKQQPIQDSAESGSASSESEESSEKPLEPKPIKEEKIPAESQPASEQAAKSEKAPEPEKPKLEEPAAVEPLKEEKKEVLEAKPSEPLPVLKVPEQAVPSIKSISSGEKDAEIAALLTNKPDVVADKPEGHASAAVATIPEKPLALPVAEKAEESPKAAATEIKEEIALPSEQKVEASPAAEEKVPETKTAEVLPEASTTVEHIEDKKDLTAPPAAEIKSDVAKKSKSEDILKLEETSEEKKLELQKPEVKPAEVQAPEQIQAEGKAPEQKQAEGKSENLPVKPLEEAKPTEAVKEEKTEEPKQEPLPTASASSTS